MRKTHADPLRRFVRVGLGTATISVALGLAGKGATSLAPEVGVAALLVVVAIGVAGDILGIAATAATETGFHAMAADRVRGAPQAIWLVRHADRVSSFANDMVGDAAGTLSGAIGAVLALELSRRWGHLSELWATTLVVAAVAGLTVGGKGATKPFAIRHAEPIIFAVGRTLASVEHLLGRPLLRAGAANRSRRNGQRNGQRNGRHNAPAGGVRGRS